MTFRIAFYKSQRPGIAGTYNRLVRKWERGAYSHCELIFSDGVSASSSFEDGGVRFRQISYDPARWDFVDLPPHLEAHARQWFIDHEGEKYDLLGNVHHVIGFISESATRQFCSEACAAALGMTDPWRYGPNVLYATLKWSCQLAR